MGDWCYFLLTEVKQELLKSWFVLENIDAEGFLFLISK